MDATMFDDLVKVVSERLTRRTLGRAAGAGALVAALAPALGDEALAGKHSKKKKQTFCLNGQTIKAKQKRKKKRLRAQGATRGACNGACVPNCAGRCNVDDGCGGTCPGCAAGSLCVAGACKACNATCGAGETPAECGASLSAALAAGGDIYVCPGTYLGVFEPTLDSNIHGAGNGDDPATNTILTGADTVRVMNIPTSIAVELSHLRFTNGNSGNLGYGGNLYIQGAAAEVTATDCVFTKANGGFGGAIYLTSGTLTADSCQFLENYGTRNGQGLYNEGGTATVTNSDFTGNGDAQTTSGAAFYSYGPTATTTFTGCTFTENFTSGSNYGGAVYTRLGTVNISDTTMTGNEARYGGAIYCAGGVTNLAASVSITGNTARVNPGGGGGVYNEGSAAAFNRNGATISGNTPDDCVGPGCS